MKARTFSLTCNCCGTPILVGEQIVKYAGRYWLTSHLTQYKARRQEMKA